MDNSKSLVTINHRIKSAERFISSVSNNSYFFVGDHVDSNTIIQPHDNPNDVVLDTHYGMIFGKKIEPSNLNVMIRRIDWESNTVYDVYDHDDDSLYDKDFYVIVKDGSQYDVFKCLENGNGAPSLVAPSLDNVTNDQEDFFYPTDGYRWKYMYSVSEADVSRFGTNEYFPVKENSDVVNKAVNGTIDVIQVVDGGEGYSNYLSGGFLVSDLRLNGNPRIYNISSNLAKTIDGYYEGCWLYISSGAGAGQYRQILDYTCNNTHNIITIDAGFDSADSPQNGSQFEIYPAVEIVGDGNETLPAKARAVVDPTSNTIARVEMLEKGRNYNRARAEVLASNTVGVIVDAGIRPIYSPYGGHGNDPKTELGGKYVCVSVELNGDEANTIVSNNDYSQVGIIENPLFKSVTLNLSENNREFLPTEYVYTIETRQLAGEYETNLNANNELTSELTVIGANGNYVAKVGDTVMVEFDNNYMLANIESLSDSSVFLDVDAIYSTGDGSANLHLVTINSEGYVTRYSANSVELTNVSGEFNPDDIVISSTTGAHGVIGDIEINGVAKNFNTFMACHVYVGSVTSGTFIEDELLVQNGNVDAEARYHSLGPDGDTSTTRFYVTYQSGLFNTSDDNPLSNYEMVGVSSGAIASLTNKYLPDLVFGSGEVTYIENSESIIRSDERSELFKLIFEF